MTHCFPAYQDDSFNPELTSYLPDSIIDLFFKDFSLPKSSMCLFPIIISLFVVFFLSYHFMIIIGYYFLWDTGCAVSHYPLQFCLPTYPFFMCLNLYSLFLQCIFCPLLMLFRLLSDSKTSSGCSRIVDNQEMDKDEYPLDNLYTINWSKGSTSHSALW